MRPMPRRLASPPQIDIQIQSARWVNQPLAEKAVRDAIFAAAAALSTEPGEVSIVLADDATIRLLNRNWRGIDRPTNVLSFPASSHGFGQTTRELGRLFGDIVIAYETIERECVEERIFFLHHLAHLTVHGFLHLVGYDHQTDAQAGAMESLESKIMRRLQMPDPYLDRDRGIA